MRALLAALLIGSAALGCGDARERPAATSTDGPRHLDIGKVSPTRVLGSLATTGDRVWAGSPHALLQLDPRTARSRVVKGGGRSMRQVVATGDLVYVLDDRTSRLTGFDARTGRVVARCRLGAQPIGLVADGATVYYTFQGRSPGVLRFDLSTGRSRHRRIRAPAVSRIAPLALLGDDLWVSTPSKLFRLDAATLSVRDQIEAPPGIDGIWAGLGTLWAASKTKNAGVWRFDVDTGTFGHERRADAGDMAFTEGAAWLATASGPKALDPDDGRIVAEGGMNPNSEYGADSIGVVGDEVWLVYPDVAQMQRLPAPAGL